MSSKLNSASFVVPFALLALCISFSQSASAQSGSRNDSGRQGNRRSAAPFEERFYNFLASAQYQNWAPLPPAGGDFYPGEGPHGAFLKIYANRIAASSPKELPHGSILIKENYARDRATLMAITVMYRAKGYDQKNGDWYWVKYDPNGRVSRMNDMPIAGRVKMCAECHSGAGGDDFVFAND